MMEQQALRHNFIQYLKAHYNYAHPEIMASNVFYAWHNDIGMDFWDIFKSEESMREARSLLTAVFEKIGRKNPKGHASVHYGCWEKFREFLMLENLESPVPVSQSANVSPEQQVPEEDFPEFGGELDLLYAIDALRIKRRLFHSEADFQFALAWEIKTKYPQADVRLEYCPAAAPNMHIDILVTLHEKVYPIELKYKTLGLDAVVDHEAYHIKSHGAQDIGMYECLRDLQRTEKYRTTLPGFDCGFVIWLTNDPYYWTPSKRQGTMAADFAIHTGAVKTGTMSWAPHTGLGTMKGREDPITLSKAYSVQWHVYSKVADEKGGQLRYAIFAVSKASEKEKQSG